MFVHWGGGTHRSFRFSVPVEVHALCTLFRSNHSFVSPPVQKTSRVLVRRPTLFRSNQLLVSRPGQNTSLVVFGASVQYRSLSSNYSLQIKESWQFSKIFNNYLDSWGSWLFIFMGLNNKIGCILTNNLDSWGGLGVITTEDSAMTLGE